MTARRGGPAELVRIWEYDVAPGMVDAFRRAYGADGDWARLFGRSAGFLGTQLLRSVAEPSRFLTVDRFVDADAWARFLEANRADYDALDSRCSGLTIGEREVCAALVDGD